MTESLNLYDIYDIQRFRTSMDQFLRNGVKTDTVRLGSRNKLIPEPFSLLKKTSDRKKS